MPRPSRFYGAHAVVRRKRFLPPILRPSSSRRLPPELMPSAAYATALAMPEGVADPDWLALIGRIDQGPYHQDTDIEVYFRGGDAFVAMLDAVNRAENEVLVEMYIISGDATGQDFLSALDAAVGRGVTVHVLADAFGSSRTRQDFWHLLRRTGSQFRLFHRPHYAPRMLLPILDHRKLLVVDRKIGFTGGMNIADEYRHGSDGEAPWRDTHVRVIGGLAWELAVLFNESWGGAGGDALSYRAHGVTADPRPDGQKTLLLDSRPGRGLQEIHSVYAALIGAARRRLWITNAYFAPHRRMAGYLMDAARRGVDVRLLLPGQSDIPLIRFAGQGYYAELLASGVRVFEYQPAVLHAKTLLVDDSVSVIGSTNFDFRSFDLNHEANVLVYGEDLAARMATQFEEDLRQSQEILPDVWRQRPWWIRWRGFLARLLAPLL